MSVAGLLPRRRDRRDNIDKYLLPIIAVIIVLSILPPISAASSSGPQRHATRAQAAEDDGRLRRRPATSSAH